MCVSATFGDCLRDLRNEAGVSQLDVAIGLGVTSSTVSKYECGRLHPNDEDRFLDRWTNAIMEAVASRRH